MKKWVKMPGPGQFRGEGKWVEVAGKFTMNNGLMPAFMGSTVNEDFYDYCVKTNYLPTSEQDEKPE